MNEAGTNADVFDDYEDNHSDPVYYFGPGWNAFTMADINREWERIKPALWAELNRRSILLDLIDPKPAPSDYYTSLPYSLRPSVTRPVDYPDF